MTRCFLFVLLCAVALMAVRSEAQSTQNAGGATVTGKVVDADGIGVKGTVVTIYAATDTPVATILRRCVKNQSESALRGVFWRVYPQRPSTSDSPKPAQGSNRLGTRETAS